MQRAHIVLLSCLPSCHRLCHRIRHLIIGPRVCRPSSSVPSVQLFPASSVVVSSSHPTFPASRCCPPGVSATLWRPDVVPRRPDVVVPASRCGHVVSAVPRVVLASRCVVTSCPPFPVSSWRSRCVVTSCLSSWRPGVATSCPPSLASGVATSRPRFPSVVLASRCGHVVSAVPSAVLVSRVDTSCPPSQCRPGVSASSCHPVRRSRCRRVVVPPSRCRLRCVRR